MDKLRGIRRRLWFTLLIALLVGSGGCTRAFYRDSADKEVNDILKEKDKYPEWKIEQYHIYPDARARFADPSNPDHPPMPPDDESAWQSSPHPQGPRHKGIGDVWGTAYLEMVKAWDAENRANHEAAQIRDGQESTKPGSSKHPIMAYMDEPLFAQQKGFLLTMDQSAELGVVNSTQYQNFREELYLAALPVTLQRFSFAYQWAAIADFIRQYAGPATPVVGQQNNWTGNSSIGFSKLFSTGALLTLDFANSTVFNFGGPNHGLTSGSTINLNFAQPFLQGGGPAVTLEPLTQAERDLFYSVRAYGRFREQFYVSIALGSSLPADLATAAGANNVTNPISVLAALGLASTDVSGGFVGYLSALYRECDMAADKKWRDDLKQALKIIEAYQEGGFYSPLQVDQVRSTLLQAENTVLTDEQFLNNALDQFKLTLGMPANLPLILDDAPGRPITRQFDRYYEVIADLSAASEKVEKQEQAPPEKMRGFLQQLFAKDPLVLGTDFAKKAPVSWDAWVKAKEKDVKERIEKLNEERRKLLDTKTSMELKGLSFSPQDEDRLREADFEVDLGTLEQELRRYEAKPWEKAAKERQAVERIKISRQVGHAAKNVLLYARRERFEAVSNIWPPPPATMYNDLDLAAVDVDQGQEAAVKAALTNRWDLMNARAQVVDAWRQLRVTANALLGVATVQYNLQATTPPTGVHPLAFSSAATNQQLTLDFQLPLNRVAQRNAYRAAQIAYQVSRRNLMNLEDNVAAQVRFDVRQLQLFTANYRIQKKVIQSLYSQVDSALEVIVAPTDPDALKASGTAGQAAAAALTSQYLTALGQLNGSQTKMYDIWLSLLATRMQLYLDLERLPLNDRGAWIDRAATPAAGEVGAEIRIPPVGPVALPMSATVNPVESPPAVLPVAGRLGMPMGVGRDADQGGAIGRP